MNEGLMPVFIVLPWLQLCWGVQWWGNFACIYQCADSLLYWYQHCCYHR